MHICQFSLTIQGDFKLVMFLLLCLGNFLNDNIQEILSKLKIC